MSLRCEAEAENAGGLRIHHAVNAASRSERLKRSRRPWSTRAACPRAFPVDDARVMGQGLRRTPVPPGRCRAVLRAALGCARFALDLRTHLTGGLSILAYSW